MRKMKRIAIVVAAIAAFGALSLTACGEEFTPLADIPQGEVSSNGGFVVKKGEYVYFINGVEAYTADNTYGSVVKGALMRAKEDEIEKGNGSAETVIPSLMVAADYNSGLYIYGERVYYATPNNIKNTEGEVENDYLTYMSAKLDGSDVVEYFRVSNNATEYRFVEKNDVVYLMYKDGSNLRSYNTASKTETLLVQDFESAVFNEKDVTDPTVYYTMKVTRDIDTDNSSAADYTQVYRVSADATQAPYEYKFDETFVAEYKEENDGKELYVNLGEIVLDGVGIRDIQNDNLTQFTHDSTADTAGLSSAGYAYTLQSYQNGGVYFTRTDKTEAGTTTTTASLYFLATEKVDAEAWSSVSGNKTSNYDVVAPSVTNASSSAIFYRTDAGHHYLYLSGSNVYRQDVSAGETVTVANKVEGASLMFLDGGYLYFNRTNGSGVSVERVAYGGKAEDYNFLREEEYKTAKLLNVAHATGWYPYELINNVAYFADNETIGTTSFNYVTAVNLKNGETPWTNADMKAFNEKYEEVNDYISDLAEESEKISNAVKTYFYTGTRSYLDDNVAYAAELGEDALYTAEELAAIDKYIAGTDLTFKDYRVLSAFVTRLGSVSESDQTTIDSHWTNLLEHAVAPVEEEGLAWWAWMLIGIGIAIVVAAAIVVPILVVRKKKQGEDAPKKEKLAVDTTDDREIDVYNLEESIVVPLEVEEDETVESAEPSVEEAPVAETAEAPAEEPVEAVEATSEEQAPAAEEAPAEAPVEE